jgi:hypothetical protein
VTICNFRIANYSEIISKIAEIGNASFKPPAMALFHHHISWQILPNTLKFGQKNPIANV